MSDLSHHDPLPSVDDLLAATDWAGQLAAARERRAAALAGREPRQGLRETKPWESPDYLAVTAPASPAVIAPRGPRVTGTPVLAPAPRRRRPVIAMAAAGLVVGGLLSPGIAERAALWLVTPGERGAGVAEARPVPRAAAEPEAPVEAAATAVAAQAGPAAFPKADVARIAFPDASSGNAARATLPDAGAPLARPAPIAALPEGGVEAVLKGVPEIAVAAAGPISASQETSMGPAAMSVPPPADGAVVEMAGMRDLRVPSGPVVTLRQMAAGADVPQREAPPIRPMAFAAVDAPRAGLPETGMSALPGAFPAPRRAEVVGGMPSAAPGDAAPMMAGEVQPRVIVFLPNGEDADAASGALASLAEAGFTAEAPGQVGFRVARTHVRHYHAADAARASAVAAAVGGEARDFTGFRPLPAPGTIEVWIAGAPRAAPVATARAQVADRPVRARGPRFILAIRPDGSRERLRVIEDGGGVVTRAGRGLGVWGGDGDTGLAAGGGGGSAPVGRDGVEAPSRGRGASPDAGRDPGAPAGRDRAGGGRGEGSEPGAEDSHDNGRGNGNGGGNAGGSGNGHGGGNGGGNGKGNGGGNGKGGRG